MTTQFVKILAKPIICPCPICATQVAVSLAVRDSDYDILAG